MKLLPLVFLLALCPLLHGYDVNVAGRYFHEPKCPQGCLVKSVLFKEWMNQVWPKDTTLIIPLDFTVHAREIRHSVCLFQHDGAWLIYDSTEGLYVLPIEGYPQTADEATPDHMQYAVQITVWNQWKAKAPHDTYGSVNDLRQTAGRFMAADRASYKPDYMGRPALTFCYNDKFFVYLWGQGTRLLEDPESSLYSGSSERK
jgi:hypothetical protein